MSAHSPGTTVLTPQNPKGGRLHWQLVILGSISEPTGFARQRMRWFLTYSRSVSGARSRKRARDAIAGVRVISSSSACHFPSRLALRLGSIYDYTVSVQTPMHVACHVPETPWSSCFNRRSSRSLADASLCGRPGGARFRPGTPCGSIEAVTAGTGSRDFKKSSPTTALQQTWA